MLIGTLLLIAIALWFVHWLTTPERRSLTVTVARMLRRAGRWMWAAGQGLEIGYIHSQRIRERISIDFEVQP